MRKHDRVKLVGNIGVYSIGCKGKVDYVGDDGYVDVTLDEDQHGISIAPPVPLPPAEESKFEVI
jgi:hypothetical protein